MKEQSDLTVLSYFKGDIALFCAVRVGEKEGV